MTKEKSSRIECTSVRVTDLVVFTLDPAGSAPTDHPLCVWPSISQLWSVAHAARVDPLASV